MRKKLIVFELNEVPYQVLDAFVNRHPASGMARMMNSAAQFKARTPDAIYLHPRTTWPTFHRGVPDTVHGVMEFNRDTSDIDTVYPQFWELLRREGYTVGVGASIGSYPVPADRKNISFYLPDMFALSADTYPSYLTQFQSFNLDATSKSSRVVTKGFDRRGAIQLLLNAPRIGLKPGSLHTLTKQLVGERVNKTRIVRRRTLQAVLTFDVVFNQIRRSQPDISTFFTNHVASSMHRYWAAAFPDDYADSEGVDTYRSALERPLTKNEMPREWIETYKDEIDYSMQECDKMIGRLLRFVDRDGGFRILVMSSMGQRAARGKPRVNEVVMRDMGQFLSGLGFDETEWTQMPGMHPTYNVRFVDEGRCDRFVERIQLLRISGKEIAVEGNGARAVAVPIRVADLDDGEDVVSFLGETYPFDEFGLSLTAIQDRVGTSGSHTPIGAALIYDPSRDLMSDFSQREVVDSTAFTAAILKAFDVPVPRYMPDVPESLSRCLN